MGLILVTFHTVHMPFGATWRCALKQSVGVVLITNLPGKGPCAVLQRRGFWNFEKMKPESWPNGCQVTAHGGVEEGEKLLQALEREAREELGEEFVEHATLRMFAEDKLQVVFVHENEKRSVTTFGMEIPHESLRLIRLQPDSGGLFFVTADDLEEIENLDKFDRLGGVPSGRIAMFEDEKQAVARAFALLV